MAIPRIQRFDFHVGGRSLRLRDVSHPQWMPVLGWLMPHASGWHARLWSDIQRVENDRMELQGLLASFVLDD